MGAASARLAALAGNDRKVVSDDPESAFAARAPAPGGGSPDPFLRQRADGGPLIARLCISRMRKPAPDQ